MFLNQEELQELPTDVCEKLLCAEKIIDSNFFEASDLIAQLVNDNFVKTHSRLQIAVSAYQTYLLNKDMQYKHCIELCEQLELNPLLQKLPNEKCFLLFNKTTALGFF